MSAVPKRPSEAANRPGLQRCLALALLCLEVGATGYLAKTFVFSALLVAVACVGTTSSFRFRLNRQRSYDLVAGLGILFSIKYLVAPDNPRYLGLFPSQQIAFTVSQFFLAVQATEFFIRRREDRLPVYFPGLGVGALACAAIVQVTPREREIFQLMCVGFAILAATYCDSSRRFIPVPGRKSVGRPAAASIALVMVGLFGWFTATILHRYEKEMDRFVMQFLDPATEGSSVGFSSKTRLGSVSIKKNTAANEIALRVEASTPPGYLRGRAFDEYREQHWLTVPSGRGLTLEYVRPDLLPEAAHTGNTFRIANLRFPAATRYTVWPSRSLAGTIFAPGGVRYLEGTTSLPSIDALGVLRADDIVPGSPYSVFTDIEAIHDNRSAAEDSMDRSSQMKTPPDWAVNDPKIRQLASSLFAGRSTPREKVGAVVDWFRQRGRYSLKVTVPVGLTEDSVAWFLKENPPAHCEFFASGAAVLLRMGGVQCRYVTGFLVTEQNPYGGSWTVRNRDAHAWVEAWDGEGEWIIVETTPVEGIPTAATVGGWQQFQEYVLGRMQRIRAAWQQRQFGLIGDLVVSLFTTRVGIAALGILILVAIWIRHRRSRHLTRTKVARSLPEDIRRMRSTLRTVDRVVGRIAGRRQPAETLLKFAERLDAIASESRLVLREAANWYRKYSTLRYAGDRTDAEARSLQQEARRLLPELRRLR